MKSRCKRVDLGNLQYAKIARYTGVNIDDFDLKPGFYGFHHQVSSGTMPIPQCIGTVQVMEADANIKTQMLYTWNLSSSLNQTFSIWERATTYPTMVWTNWVKIV